MVNRTISWLNNWLIDWLTCVQVTEPEYYHSMVKMHLSFLLDLHTDECDCSFLYEKQVPGIIIIIIIQPSQSYRYVTLSSWQLTLSVCVLMNHINLLII